MNKNLQEKLSLAKNILDSDFSYIDIACLEVREDKNYKFKELEEDVLSDYVEIFSEYSYMRFGDIIFWLEKDLFKKRQINLMLYEVPNPEKWVCIGEAEPYPLLINKQNGQVFCITSEPGESCSMKEYEQFNIFMEEYVLGEKYYDIGTDEEWYEFMKNNNII